MPQRTLINGVDFTEVLTSAQVARLFPVDPKTVTRWANEGKLSTVRTPGKHRRYSRAEVEERLRSGFAGCEEA